jgi:O-antigen ligase
MVVGEPIDVFLAAMGGFGLLCWLIWGTYELSVRRPDRSGLIPAIFLGIAAFAPAGLTLLASGRESLGETAFAHVLIPIYLLALALTALFTVPNPSPGKRKLVGLLVAYWAVGLLADMTQGNPPGDISFFVVPVALVGAWLYAPSYRAAVGLLTWGCIAVCGVSLLLAVVDPSVAFPRETARIAHFLSPDRLAGITEHPNSLGFIAALGVVLSWRRIGMSRFVGISICGVAMIASDSRTAWMACLAGLVVLFLGRRQQERPLTPVKLVGAIIVLGVGAYLAVTLLVPEGHALSFDGRTEAWSVVIKNWTQTPIIGHGPEIWGTLISAGQLASWIGQAHNQFLQTLFTTGLLGVLILLAIVWIWTSDSFRAAQGGMLLPLAVEAVIVVDCIFESQLTLTRIDSDVWLFSLVLFLQPLAQRAAARSRAERQLLTVAG